MIACTSSVCRVVHARKTARDWEPVQDSNRASGCNSGKSRAAAGRAMLYRTSAAAQYRYVYVEYVRPRSTSGRAVHVQYVGVHDLCIDTVSLMLCLHYVGVHSLGLIVCLHAPRPQNHIVIAPPYHESKQPDGGSVPPSLICCGQACRDLAKRHRLCPSRGQHHLWSCM